VALARLQIVEGEAVGRSPETRVLLALTPGGHCLLNSKRGNVATNWKGCLRSPNSLVQGAQQEAASTREASEEGGRVEIRLTRNGAALSAPSGLLSASALFSSETEPIAAILMSLPPFYRARRLLHAKFRTLVFGCNSSHGYSSIAFPVRRRHK
jgi:hypothetical protein